MTRPKNSRKKNPLIQTKYNTTTKRGMREYQRKYYRLKNQIPPRRYGKTGPRKRQVNVFRDFLGNKIVKPIENVSPADLRLIVMELFDGKPFNIYLDVNGKPYAKM